MAHNNIWTIKMLTVREGFLVIILNRHRYINVITAALHLFMVLFIEYEIN